MKNRLKNLLLALTVVVAFTACKDDEGLDSTATPVVKYIRYTDPAQSDVYLTSASMGELIAIIGSGLEGVCSVRFNDVEAKLNPTYITANSVLVNVPGTLPTEITNTITLTTRKGRTCVVENFVSKAPAPVIGSVSCEWAKPGDAVVIRGNYFFSKADGSDPELTIGGLPVAIDSYTNTELFATIPAGLDTSVRQRITLENDNGTGRSMFYLYDRSDIFIDFEDLSWDWWGRSSGDIFTDRGIDGSYMFLNGTSAAWNWNEDLSLFYCNINEDGSVNTQLLPEGDDVSDYSLKFEIRADAWVDGYMAMWFTGEYNTFSIDGDEAQCHWRGYEQGLSSGEWTTVTIPLTEFCCDKEETTTSRTLKSSDMKSFCIFFFGSLSDDANSGAALQIAVDNFRLVKKQ